MVLARGYYGKLPRLAGTKLCIESVLSIEYMERSSQTEEAKESEGNRWRIEDDAKNLGRNLGESPDCRDCARPRVEIEVHVSSKTDWERDNVANS